MGDKKYKDKHRLAGLCIDCSRPARVGYLQCEIHSGNNRERSIRDMPEVRQKYKDEGKCVVCSAPLPDIDAKDGYSACCNCRHSFLKPKGSNYYIGE